MKMELKKHQKLAGPEGPVLIIIMDGVGLGPENEGNAVHLARTPNLDHLMKTCPWISIAAHGTAVGLPSDADMGNSEVGHNAIGSGKVCDQGAKLVNRAMDSGDLFRGETWKWLLHGLNASGEEGGTLHIMGLLSDGNVHSHITQIFTLIDGAHRDGVRRLRFHTLLDGRDVGETSALIYIDPLEEKLARISSMPDRDYRVASGGGRMTITMDRYEADLSMVKRGWECHVEGKGRAFASAREAVLAYREEQPGMTDQYLPAFVIADGTGPVGTIKDGDSVIFANFRGDRAIEISRAFEEEGVWGMERERRPSIRFAGMMEYDGDLKVPKHYLVAPPAIEKTMGEYLAANGVPQLAISETQKYGHVTYFWNGNRSGKFNPGNETYIEIPSDVIPFDQKPKMKAAEIAEATIRELKTGKYRQARINFANGDMVGHTGKLDAAIIAVETVDHYVGKVLEAIRDMKGMAIVTADHGNADEMFMMEKGIIQRNASGRPVPKTSHTLNAVPFIIYDPRGKVDYRFAARRKFGLGNIAATALNLMGYQSPEGFCESMLQDDH